MKKRLKKLLTIVMSAMMLVVFMPTSTFAAGTNDQQTGQPEQGVTTTPPAAEKTLVPNGDGTYKLSLSVTGKSETSSESSKADVVVIMDVSGSMSNTTKVYEEKATGRYGFIGGQYVQLYSYSDGWGHGEYNEIENDSYTGTVYYKSGSNHIEYKETRYASATKSRLAVAKQSVGDLAQQLLANNDGTNTDKVELSLISFSNVAKTEVKNTTDIDSFKNKVDKLSANGGTNWEDALQEVTSIDARDDATKYVIFVSDGNPTFRNTKGDYKDIDKNDDYNEEYGVWGTGRDANAETVTRCYDHAKDYAKALVDAGWQFYGIGVFGNVDRMKSLVNYAYYGDNAGTASDKYFSATDQAQLAAAFQNIINSITQNFGYSNVVINDGLTGLVSCDISGEADGFTYTKNGKAWAEAPQATLTGKQVEWNLGNTQLENGVKYTVSFNVWPSQKAYDLVADLKNGVKTYNDLTDDEKAQIDQTSDGGYGLNTNTAAGVTYNQIETKTTTTEPEGYKSGKPAADGYVYVYNETTKLYTGTKSTEGSAEIDNPDPIPVVSYNMVVNKEWEGGAGSAVTLELLKDGEPTGVKVELNKDNNWTGSVFLAPGLVVGEDTKEIILDDGHNYSLRETPGGTEYYSFSSNTQHPMLVNSATNVVKNLTNPDDIRLDDIGTLVGTNTLIPPSAVSKELKILKKVTGKDAIENFAFELSLDGENGDTEGVTDAEGNAITTLTAQSSSTTKIVAGGQEYVSFGNVKFSKEGTYVFKVREKTTTTAGGWTYDSTTKEIEVKVEKASDKNELVIASISVTPEFTNSYSASDATISIPVKKSLTGTGANTFDISNAFTFTLEGKNGAPMPETTTITNPDSNGGTASFGDITYTEAGTYEYKVKESGSVDGIVNDANSEKTVTVTVTDEEGQLVASIVPGNDITEDGALKFTNKVIEPKDVQLQVTKKVQGKDATVPFTFSIELAKGNRAGVVMPQNNKVITTNSIEAGAQDTVSFDSIRFTKAGTYTFDVKEVYTDTDVPAGWTYDSATKQISVTVEKDSVKDELTVTSISDTPVFTNSYKASPVTDFQIPVTKVLDVSDGSDTDAPDITKKYTFTLAAVDNAPMPETTTITNPDSNGGTAYFGKIRYEAAGTYTYTVTESGSVDGIENDPVLTKTVTVTVKDEEGQLVASIAPGDNITEDGALKFTNKVIEPIEVPLQVTKKVEGRDATEASTFSIRQTNTDDEDADGAVMPSKTTISTTGPVKVGTPETVTFDKITFTKPGTYTFNVKETNADGPAGWTYDNKVERTITVVVSKTNGVLSYEVKNGNPTFINKYSASAVEDFTIPVKKDLVGTGAPDITGKYTFTLEGKNGAPMPAVTQYTNPKAGGGTVEFGPITYTKAGTYHYTVTETGSVAHITNDSKATKNITVEVKDEGAGQLVASITEDSELTFKNTYAPELTKANISVKKDLVGTGAPDITGEYTFKLEAVDNAPMPANNTELTNPSANGGTVTFGDITYTKAGTYIYKVTESGNVPGITNDSSATKEVTVVVEDINGKLSAVVNSDETLTFTNTYEPEAVSVDLEVKKVLKNMKLTEGQFTFQLLDNQDKSNAVQQKENAADGTVAFDELEYKYPGVYNYTIKEVIPDDAGKVKGVTYDKHEVKVKVTVTDTDNDGKLSATVEYEGDQTFTNTYNASGKSTIFGVKILDGKTLEAGKYTFKLEGKDGAPMPDDDTATNNADGFVYFEDINFTLSDLDTADEDKSDEDGSDGKTEGDSTVEGGSQETAAAAASEVEGADDVNSDENKEEDATVPRTKTFTYTVTEVAGNETGITYDTTPQEFTITVTDDREGGLTVTTNPPTGEQNAPLFTIKNVYTPAKATIDVTKAFIDGRTGLNAWDEEKYADEEFEFELKAVGNAPLNPVDSSTASTTVTTSATSPYASFGIYEFDEAGTYEYTITEKNTGSGDVEYDTANHKVTVVVIEDETTHQLSADVKYDDNKGSLTVTNTLKPADNAKLNVVKHVVNTNGQPLSVNGEFHVALFSDKALKHRVSAVKTLEFNGSDPTAKVPFDVTPGRTYYVAETDADGKALGGAQKFDDQLYYICFGDPSGIEDVTDYPQYGEAAIPDSGTAEDVVFSNIFDGSKFMILGSITINKEVKIGKETKAVDGSFYVTAEYSQGNSDTIEKQTVELKVKDGKTQQPETISNLPTNTEITLKETDANGDALKNSVYNPIFTYGDESGETLKVTLTEEDSDIDVNLVNSEKLIDVAFDLKWDDYKNRDNTRDEYAVTLYANGVEVKDSTMTFSYDVTEGKWTDLRQYDDDGNEIVYSVKQTVVPENYSSNTDGTEFGLAPDVDDGIVHLIDVYRAVTITKKVTDSTGKAIKYNGDFYVTMFADPEGKEIAMDPVKITLNNEKSKTVIIPVPANTLYYLAETDEDGNKVDSSFEFIPTFSSTIAEVTDDAVSIVLTNEAKAGTPVDDPDNDSDTKTGDSANLMLMLLALLTSMLIGIVVLLRGRRRENN